jgi:hypothetical protein
MERGEPRFLKDDAKKSIRERDHNLAKYSLYPIESMIFSSKN